MKTYHIVSDGFSKFFLSNHVSTSPYLGEEDQALLDRFVEKKKVDAKSAGGSFYDGDLVGIVMDSLCAKGDSLIASTQNLKYSQHRALFSRSHDSRIQAFYVNGIMITSDNRLLFGRTQSTESQWMGKLGLPAGAVNNGPDGYPNPGTQALREFQEEVGLAIDYHVLDKNIIPGWINGMSSREGNYHLTQSYICPLLLSAQEMKEYFRDWKNSVKKQVSKYGKKTELGDVEFLPNDKEHLINFIEEQDTLGKNARLLGKSLDVLEEWTTKYDCDLENLKDYKKSGACIYLPQPEMSGS